MEFKISAEEAQRLAEIETEVGGVISAGPDLGGHLGDVMRLELFGIDHRRIVTLLDSEFGNMLSPGEIEEVAADLQAQIEAKLIQKMNVSAASGRSITSLHSHASRFDSAQQHPSDAVSDGRRKRRGIRPSLRLSLKQSA
jgi:hypothetical protein